tara:strand:- start:143 stop:1027 length:885 start_codon:yes stop_codon:yes gene_type:complete
MNDEKLFYNDLKSQREAQGLTLEEISEFTKIDIKFLIAIEDGDFSCLPSVYMRLFLRSYCQYISADPDKALNDYEFFTLGSKTETKSFVPRSDDLPDPTPKINEKELNLPQVPTTKIITIVVTVVCLISAFFFLRYLGSGSDEIDSEDGISQTNEEEVLSLEQPVQYSKLPNDSPLNNSNFLITKRLSENSVFLEESPKYVLRVEALARTKININNSVKDKPESTNEIIDAGEIRTFFISKQISFDFWSASHIDVQINDIKLNNYFGSQDQSIRGTFDITDQKLWYAIYPQTAG